jgi:hypothetical protein
MTTTARDRDKKTEMEAKPLEISTGAGIAIAGICIACALLTIYLLWWTFIHDKAELKAKSDGSIALIAFVLCVLPVFWARHYVRRILDIK